MAWKGFVEESKSYMNHPDYSSQFVEHKAQLYLADGTLDFDYPGWTVTDKRKATLEFWRKFPRAWIRFYWSIVYDWLTNNRKYR